ncbi:MAG: hypothetical protein JW861_01880 [Bacteroidales bacterium]|nr:hypothetical protein [Bacteroidales bacterium]
MKASFHIPVVCFILTGLHGFPQDEKPPKTDLNGYFLYLQAETFSSINGPWLGLGTIQNRLNFKWFPSESLTMSAGARNLFTFGGLFHRYYPYYKDLLLEDPGRMNLTGHIVSDSSYILYSHIDRLNAKWSWKKLEVTAGRQRINWGINMVWNPNDIFNTFSYYDFSYPERPGCDAVRLEYFVGPASSAQLAVKITDQDKVTAAGMYRFNRWDYDFQVLAGVMEQDLVIGGGWSGHIRGAGFNGELTWFHDDKDFIDTTGTLIASAGVNYTFSNSLFIHGSVLYNSRGTTEPAGRNMSILNLRELSPKTLTSSRASLFGQVSYPITPLIRADLAAIVNPYDGSAFFGPNMEFSVSDNTSLLLMGQIFSGKSRSEFGDYGQFYYVQLKWVF